MELAFIKNQQAAMASLLAIEESMKQLPRLSLADYSPDTTAIVLVDMVNGFVNQGPLASERALPIVPTIKQLVDEAEAYHKIYLTDYHQPTAEEFKTYPPHCQAGSEETQIVKELIPIRDEKTTIIKKNSTNGFLAPGFQQWLTEHQQVDTFVVTGLVTDICVMAFCLTLKAYFNQLDQSSRIMVPLTGVETFNLPETHHQPDVMNLFALYTMRMNGVELVDY